MKDKKRTGFLERIGLEMLTPNNPKIEKIIAKSQEQITE